MNITYFAGSSHDVAVLSHNNVAISLENDKPGRATPVGQRTTGDQPGAKPSVSTPNLALFPSFGGDIMPWGEGNDFPQRIRNLYNKDPLIPQTLGKTASMLVGKGVMAVEIDLDDNGDEIVRAVRDPEINEFIHSLHFRKYLHKTAGHVAWFFNAFPEPIVTKNRKKILYLNPLPADECRWCRMTPEGDLPYVYLNANWPNATTSDAHVKQIHALDAGRWDKADWLREQRFFNCIYPISYPTPGFRFYSLAHHHSIVESGWLDVHLAVPEFKKFLMKNQVSLKYHFKVDATYWGMTYGDAYTKGTPDAKRAIKKTWLEGMNKALTDVEKAGGSIITEMTWDKEKKVFIDHIQIEPITDAMKDGKYIEDNLEAASNILYAFGLDPVLLGFAGGANQAARSGGSDKREAYLIALQMLAPFRDMLLEPLEFVAEYNGWKARFPNLRFQFRDTILTTLDTGAGTKKTLS
ncbi:hypothetical protein G8759_31330 [Spirosoma aureum]|uniref:Phage portal protein n=1 Tax=Spirosoma aureum TaxID=2692134 RepID=A0A6G9AWH1_9BACT|nr:hypothetical protein [Spirosoma aureum]QIP16817.1 hypothetical protein G8759_31330 [Spirosoma aureum]